MTNFGNLYIYVQKIVFVFVCLYACIKYFIKYSFDLILILYIQRKVELHEKKQFSLRKQNSCSC